MSYYGMLYHRCVEQIRAVPAKEQREALRPLLIGLWQIMSELEQIAFLVGSGTLERRDLASVYLFAGAEQKRIAGLSAASAPVSGKSAPASKTSAPTPGRPLQPPALPPRCPRSSLPTFPTSLPSTGKIPNG